MRMRPPTATQRALPTFCKRSLSSTPLHIDWMKMPARGKLSPLEYPKNHNSLGCEQPLGLDVNRSPIAQDAFRPMPGLITCTGATRSVGVTCHAHATQMAGLKYPLEPRAAGSTSTTPPSQLRVTTTNTAAR